MISAQTYGLGATANPCDAISNATTREACKIALATRGPNAVAQFLVAKGGQAACAAAGAGALAPLCSKAAQAVYNWIVAGYTPAEIAEILWRAAQGAMPDSIFAFEKMGLSRFGSGGRTPGFSYDPWKTALANLRTNLKLLGYGEVWKQPKDAGTSLILLGMITKGAAGKDPLWWRVKARSAADLSPLPYAPSTSPSGGVHVPITLPPGAITAWSAKMNRWRVAVPRAAGMSGPGEGSFLTRPGFWITAGAVVLIGVGGYYLLRRKHSQRRSTRARAAWRAARAGSR